MSRLTSRRRWVSMLFVWPLAACAGLDFDAATAADVPQNAQQSVEAQAACTGAELGTACAFTAPNGETRQGVCGEDGSGQMSCQCQGDRQGRGRHRWGPPPEALAACAEAAEGEHCAFTARNGMDLEGRCGASPHGEMVCRPDNAPTGEGHGRHHRGPPPQAFDACAELDEGAVCSFANLRGDTMEGVCAQLSEGQLACRPGLRPQAE